MSLQNGKTLPCKFQTLLNLILHLHARKKTDSAFNVNYTLRHSHIRRLYSLIWQTAKINPLFQVKYSEGGIKVPYPKSRFIKKRVPKICVNDKVAASWSSGLVCESQNRPVLGGSYCGTVHPTDITTACGSPAPKPFFFWNMACVSEQENSGGKKG